jgi:hypothetical protein
VHAARWYLLHSNCSLLLRSAAMAFTLKEIERIEHIRIRYDQEESCVGFRSSYNVRDDDRRIRRKFAAATRIN